MASNHFVSHCLHGVRNCPGCRRSTEGALAEYALSMATAMVISRKTAVAPSPTTIARRHGGSTARHAARTLLAGAGAATTWNGLGWRSPSASGTGPSSLPEEDGGGQTGSSSCPTTSIRVLL